MTNDVIYDTDGQFLKNHKNPLIVNIILRQKSSLGTVIDKSCEIRIKARVVHDEWQIFHKSIIESYSEIVRFWNLLAVE